MTTPPPPPLFPSYSPDEIDSDIFDGPSPPQYFHSQSSSSSQQLPQQRRPRRHSVSFSPITSPGASGKQQQQQHTQQQQQQQQQLGARQPGEPRFPSNQPPLPPRTVQQGERRQSQTWSYQRERRRMSAGAPVPVEWGREVWGRVERERVVEGDVEDLRRGEREAVERIVRQVEVGEGVGNVKSGREMKGVREREREGLRRRLEEIGREE
ncbi:hypothetical protein EX30DRAFT_80589 [Ascodesmis nigricans]|uniref:Uncharacterized protein n=1 Tax=Ascodesmis nigricans TaxID=341454 RepID=A0A4S2MT38_9PEZI|nr:hypothetical protein EX30DRAFT_80589 [Ascodesmis nigricans]